MIAILTCEFDIKNTGIPIESFPSTYTNFIEHAGGRAIPISYKLPPEELDQILDQVNGVLFTGGDIDQYNRATGHFHNYYVAAKHIIQYVVDRNQNGDFFPLFAICQGFQTLHMVISNDPFILSNSRRWGFNDTFNPFGKVKDSRMLSAQHVNLFDHSPGSNIEFNWHMYGIYLEDYDKYPVLRHFFRILATDEVPDSKTIVSAVEAFDYPIYSVQYHPEKNIFDFLNPNIPKTRRAQQHTEDLAFFFVSEAKKNKHRFASYEIEVQNAMSQYPRYFGLFEHNGDNVFVDYYVFE